MALGLVQGRFLSTSIFATEKFLSDFANSDANSSSRLFDSQLSKGGVLDSSSNKGNITEALSTMQGGTVTAMKLRNLAMKHKEKHLSNILKDYLQSCFSTDVLEFRRVTFEKSTGVMLERVAEKDNVLTKIRTLRELKKRLGNGRRCYALLHPHLPEDPVAFIHVALTQELATGLSYLDRHCIESESPTIDGISFEPKCAMFYSVNSPHSALSGLDLASRIIKLSVNDLRNEYPSIDTFSTLSPIPGFNTWLQKLVNSISTNISTSTIVSASAHTFTGNDDIKLSEKMPQEIIDSIVDLSSKSSAPSNVKGNINIPINANEIDVLKYILSIVTDPSYDWFKNNLTKTAMRSTLEWLGRQYLATSKANNGTPYDPVARFHLRNGASLHRLNWMGNDSLIGMSRSSGLMVNYMYSLDALEQRSQEFPNIHVNEAFWHTTGSGEA
jgi:hypothetical protein